MSRSSLQSITGGNLRNHSPFGRAIQRSANQILSTWLERVDYGFQDGGCLMFALALQRWSGNFLDLSAVFSPSRGNVAQHFMASHRDCLFLDSDGIARKSDLLRKMTVFDGLHEPWVFQVGATHRGEIPLNEDLVDFLITALQSHLGPFREHLILDLQKKDLEPDMNYT